jgi:uncharacterized membrane protein
MMVVATVQVDSFLRRPAYDIVLLAHILTAVVGLAVVASAGGYALVLRRPGELSESVERYYRPGVNWAGRIIFLVPILGVVLLAMSDGTWSFSDGWVELGLVLWAAAGMAGEMVLWPAERRLQQLVTLDPSDHAGRHSICLQVAAASAVLVALFVVAAVVMVSKP